MLFRINILFLRWFLVGSALLFLLFGLWFYWDQISLSTAGKYFLGLSLVLLLSLAMNVVQATGGKKWATKVAEEMSYDLTASRELFLELYKNSPVPYVLVTQKGVISSPNIAAVRLFGFDEKELTGKNISDLMVSEDDTLLSLILGRLQIGDNVNDEEIQISRNDGSLRWVIVSAFPYGQKKGGLVSLFDVTKQKEIDAAKSEFVSLASHQLRTPISSIKWNLELLNSDQVGELNDEQRKYIGKLERGIEKMNLLVKDFLSASQLELGTFATEESDVVISTMIEEVLDEFSARVNAKEINVVRQFFDDTISIRTDAHLLHMVTSNLVSNAIKYTRKGGKLTVGFEVEEAAVTISVSDNGIGIPEVEQEKLFTKFFRASNARLKETEGTGLGLYIVARAVEILGGTISVTSAEDKGTTFTVTLPR